MFYSIDSNTGNKTPLASASAVQSAIQAGNLIVDDSGFSYNNSVNPGSWVDIGGIPFLKGCPITVLFGAPMTLQQAQMMVANAGVFTQYGYTQCLNSARGMIGAPAPGPVGVSNPPVTNPAATGTVPQTSPGGYTAAATAGATAPSIPSGLPTGTGSSVGGQMLTTVYRFILQVSGGYATGANLQGCSQTNSAMCDPQFFTTLQQAIAYAIANGQVPYQVFAASDPWALMSGQQQINPAQIYNADGSLGGSFISNLPGGAFLTSPGPLGLPWWQLIAAGVAAYYLMK